MAGAKDTGTMDIPKNMSLCGVTVAGNEVAEAFAQFFEKKVKNIEKQSKLSMQLESLQDSSLRKNAFNL